MQSFDGSVAFQPRLITVTPVDRASEVPLWSQVRTDIERRLRRGEFAAVFPGELDLVREYDVSRQTVRQALRSLRESGLVAAARGRMPTVSASAMREPRSALDRLFASLRAEGRQTSSVVRRLDVVADGTVATRLGLEESTPLVRLERLRFVDAEPLALDRAWLPAHLARPLLDVDLARESFYGALERVCGLRFTGARELLQAVVLEDGERSMLGAPARTAGVAISRTGVVVGEAVEWRQVLIRGDRFSLLSEQAGSGHCSITISGHRQSTQDPQAWRRGAALVGA